MTAIFSSFSSLFHRRSLRRIDELTTLDTQTRKDSWQAVRDVVFRYLQKTGGKFSNGEVKEHFKTAQEVYAKGAVEIREALSELSAVKAESAAPGSLRLKQVV